MNTKKKVLVGIIVAVSIVLAIYNHMVLPETVVVQVDFSGNPSNTIPKAMAVVFPALISICGGLGYYFSEEKAEKYLILSIIGVLLPIITSFLNR